MMNQTTLWAWTAALSLLSLSDLIDGFLDRIEQLSEVMTPAPIEALASIDIRTRVLRD